MCLSRNEEIRKEVKPSRDQLDADLGAGMDLGRAGERQEWATPIPSQVAFSVQSLQLVALRGPSGFSSLGGGVPSGVVTVDGLAQPHEALSFPEPQLLLPGYETPPP